MEHFFPSNNQRDGYGLQVLVTCVFLMVPSINLADTATCRLGHTPAKIPSSLHRVMIMQLVGTCPGKIP